MRDGLIESFLDEQNRGEIVVRVGGIGINFQRGLEIGDGLGILPFRRERKTQVVQDVGLVRRHLQGVAVIVYGFVPVAKLGEGVTQIVERVRIIGFDLQRLSKTIHCLRDSSVSRQPGAEVVAGNEIIFRHRQRMPEKCPTVLPITDLVPRPPSTGGEDDCRQKDDQWPGHAPARAHRTDAPDQDDKYANRRQVAVAVGHGCVANLDQTNHRNKRPDKPKPAGEEERKSPGKQNGIADRPATNATE